MNSERIENAVARHSEAELNLLRESIKDKGVIEPVIMWRGTIVDGYARHRIATDLGIPYKTVEIDFANETEAIIWRVKTHIGRRNLTPFQKCEMVLLLEPELRQEAKKRQGWRSDVKGAREDCWRTREFLANMAGVSSGSINRAKYICEHGDEETKQRLRKGEISINFAYCTLRQRPLTPIQTVPAASLPAAINLYPIKTAIDDLRDRVTDGEASPKAIVAELNRLSAMIEGVME